MLTLVLVRHGESEDNAAGRYHGHTDAPLTPAGRAQALALRDRLAPLTASKLVRVVSSDLGRARATAEIALPGQAVACDARLRELHFGAFEGCSHETCLALYGTRYRSWLIDPASVRPPGSETLAELETRVIDWLGRQPLEDVTIAISHAGPILMLLARLLDVSFDAARRAGLAHGDGVRLRLHARLDAPGESKVRSTNGGRPGCGCLLGPPIWLSDELQAAAGLAQPVASLMRSKSMPQVLVSIETPKRTTRNRSCTQQTIRSSPWTINPVILRRRAPSAGRPARIASRRVSVATAW